jgi:hypothetical protein
MPGIAGRIARSLWRDLVLPWTISAVLIVLLMLMVFAFGLIAWPIAFCLFLFVCVQRAGLRVATMEQSGAHGPVPYVDGLDGAALLDRLGIVFNGKFYSHAGFDFDRPEQAIAFARQRRSVGG